MGMTIDEAINHLYTYSSTKGSGITTLAQHEEAKRIAIDTMRKYQQMQGVLDKIRAEIEQKAFSTEIFDEELFNSTYTESVSKETAECESIIETEVVKLRDVLQILDKYKAEVEPQESEDKE